MKLLSLTLTNFKGIRHFALDTNGGNVDIFGENATGKTTLLDSFLWLLFGKDSQNKKDFALKTLDAANNPIPGIDHDVEGTFQVNGRPLTLKKSYKEKHTKKRGSAMTEFTGHTTDHFIDGVPVSEKVYSDRIAGIIDENIFKLLTSPTYFNEQLHWQKRREILLQICGDVDDAEVIASDRSLAKLPDILNGRKLDDHRKVIAAKRADINKELEKIPVRIDEATRSLPDISAIHPDKLQEDIFELKKAKDEKQGILLQMQSGGEVARLRNQLSTVNADLQDLQNQFNAANYSVVAGKHKVLGEVENALNKMATELSSKTAEMKYNNTRITSLEAKAAKLRDKWHEANSRLFELNQETVCPACGQDLPQEQLAEAWSKAEAAFNLDKAEKLAEISSEGKQIKAEIIELVTTNTELQRQGDVLTAKINASTQNIDALKQEIISSHQGTTVEDWPGYTQKLAEKDKLEAAMDNAQQGHSEAIAQARHEVADIGAAIAAMETSLAKVEMFTKGKERIGELEKQEKLLAAEFGKLEGELYLTEQFIRTKVKLLEERINGRFKYARFVLFETQVNGGLVETCQTSYLGVPYDSMNNAARYLIGLDIIETLSEYHGFTAPVWIDNAEAITKLPKIQSQLIALYVSEGDKALRVEHDTQFKVVAS